ncbi:MAG: hypothetical protein SOS22_06905 [Absicoccus sp.]|uniref:hypothetical protein n=1 Tax=Absicoccus sp. TaxID=2718527 RepID=UPI002A7641BF|nr:hypothetical protein [Absicoccus sp.]MDY3035932.1 hypothetical protein [Absicoccus sp.]
MYTQQNWEIRKSNVEACTRMLAIAGAFAAIGLGTNVMVHADEVNQAPVPLEENLDLESNTTIETTEKQDTKIPASVDHVTQDQAVSTIDDAQDTLAKDVEVAKKSDVIIHQKDTEKVTINDQNATKKTNEMLKELNDAALSVKEAKEAMDIIHADQKALQESTEQMDTIRHDALKLIEENKGKANNLQAKIVLLNLPDKDYTPEYVSLEGLTGQALRDAIHQNQLAYSAAVSQAIANQDKLAASLRQQLETYRQALADYESGESAKKSGVQWTDNTTVVAKTAQKMTGNENVVDFASGSLKDAARYAIQSNALNQNTDAEFNNIFKINGSGSVMVRNTSNGDVQLTFSNIQAPNNTGTYVAIWGKNNGAIAWGVFATYSGTGSSGNTGEGGNTSGGWSGSGRILDFVRSYDFKVETTGEVATFTFNDIDNDQLVSNLGGMESAKNIEAGKNVKHTNAGYSAGSGDVSQSSGNILDSNSVRWSWNQSAKRSFVGSHSTSGNNSSIVAGIFGEDSMIAMQPEEIKLAFEKGVVTPPEIEVSVPKYEVETTITSEQPPVSKISQKQRSVDTGVEMNLFMSEMMTALAALGGVIIKKRI